jgi:hypothetical protein
VPDLRQPRRDSPHAPKDFKLDYMKRSLRHPEDSRSQLSVRDEAVVERSSRDTSEMGIGTFKAVERMPEIVEVMCAGIDFLLHREIDLTGFFVSRYQPCSLSYS